MTDQQSLSVPTDAVLAAVRAQRNNALDENATLRVLVEQLVAERDELAAQLRGRADAGQGP